VFGSTVIDLTDAKEDPLTLADGYEPVRDRLGNFTEARWTGATVTRRN